MIIRTNKTQLDLSDFQRVVENGEYDYRYKRRLKDYYLGRHDILRKEGRTNTDVNNKLIANYPAYITNMSTGFFIGQPVTYKTTQGEFSFANIPRGICRGNPHSSSTELSAPTS